MKGGFITIKSALGIALSSRESIDRSSSLTPPRDDQSRTAQCITKLAIEIATGEISWPMRTNSPEKLHLRRALNTSWRNTPEPQAGSHTVSFGLPLIFGI